MSRRGRSRPHARAVLQGLANLIRREDLAPGAFDRLDDTTVPASHLGDARAEVPVHADEHRVAGLDDRRDRRLHTCGPGARDRQSQTVRGLKRVPQQLLRAVHQDQEVRVEVAEQRRRHRGRHAGVDHVRSRAEEDPWGHVVRLESRRLDAQVRHDRLTPSSRDEPSERHPRRSALARHRDGAAPQPGAVRRWPRLPEEGQVVGPPAFLSVPLILNPPKGWTPNKRSVDLRLTYQVLSGCSPKSLDDASLVSRRVSPSWVRTGSQSLRARQFATRACDLPRLRGTGCGRQVPRRP